MASTTPKLNLYKKDPVADGNDTFNVETMLNENWDKIDADKDAQDAALATHLADYTLQVPFAAATGSANTYAVTLNPAPTSLVTGMAIAVKINVDSTAASTINVNGLGAKGIKKANGTDITNLKAGGIYTLRYDGVNFTLQGEGASGNATASDLLSGKTASTDAGEITGTMPNRGAISQSLAINGSYTIPEGYHNGSGKVAQSITTKGAQTYTPGTSNQTIAAGQYLSGAQTISGDVDLVAANIKKGVNVFGVTGTYETPIVFSAGDNIIFQEDGERATSGSAVKTYEVKMIFAGTVRTYFELKNASGGSSNGQIYKNGVAVGTKRTASGTPTWTGYSEDFQVSANDLLQLYITGTASYPGYSRNFRIKTDQTPYVTKIL